jgi:hypothetical protein
MALKEVDLRRGDGLVRQLLRGKDVVAVLDVSDDVLTVNWTTHRTAPQFVDFVSDVPTYKTADAYVCTASDEVELDMDGLGRLAKDSEHGHSELWRIVRLDLSDTRSIAWERLFGGTSVIGFGDEARCMRAGINSEAAEQLGWLLRETGTEDPLVTEVVHHAVELSQLWKHHERREDQPSAIESAETSARAGTPEDSDTEGQQHE